MMPWPGLIEPFTECFGLGLLGAVCVYYLLEVNPLLFLLVHTVTWFIFDLLLLKLIEVYMCRASTLNCVHVGIIMHDISLDTNRDTC